MIVTAEDAVREQPGGAAGGDALLPSPLPHASTPEATQGAAQSRGSAAPLVTRTFTADSNNCTSSSSATKPPTSEGCATSPATGQPPQALVSECRLPFQTDERCAFSGGTSKTPRAMRMFQPKCSEGAKSIVRIQQQNTAVFSGTRHRSVRRPDLHRKEEFNVCKGMMVEFKISDLD